ncbi:uncharacterized protein LOC105788861 [Gossypium raimondii]|uniref:uncharacterized protein LOC105788861 n=1 Tax=Gossypium raimondii TaxID=29730 RepID=UPI00227D3CAB|nr:uncharacterized protein LOC105788861 [Gossypium raimondii]
MSGKRMPMKTKSCNYDADRSNSAGEVDVSNGKILARTTSRRSRIFGLVFGRRSMKEDGYQEAICAADVMRLDPLERAEIAADLLELTCKQQPLMFYQLYLWMLIEAFCKASDFGVAKELEKIGLYVVTKSLHTVSSTLTHKQMNSGSYYFLS